MEESTKRLYPLRFDEKEAEMPWGNVSYHIADLGSIDSMLVEGWFGGNTISELMGTYLERVVGDDAFEYYGLQFPILVKVIRTTGMQPLQVNVGDREAEERYDSFGKTAFWYIKEAAKDSVLYLGLNTDVESGEFYGRCHDGSVTRILNEIHPKAGDSFVIKPGTVFAAGPGLTIVEISECSELSLDLETELEEAFDLIDFHQFESPSEGTDLSETVDTPGQVRGGTLAECDEFKVTRFDLRDPIHIFSDQPGSFAIYHCISGEAFIQAPDDSGNFGNWHLRQGRSILVPSEVNDYIVYPVSDGTVLLEAMVERRMTPDSYIGDTPEGETPDPHVRQWR